MVLIERYTGIPLDLVVLINSFLPEIITDDNFKQVIAMWFGNEEQCKQRFGHIKDWVTSRVTNMSGLFYQKNVNEDLSRWDVSHVTEMRSMFRGASQFNRDIGQWNVRNVTDMCFMFSGANRFNQDLGRWDVCNVTDMRFMFYEASQFNQDLGRWDVCNVTKMRFMFSGANRFNQDLSRWDASIITDMRLMFSETLPINKHYRPTQIRDFIEKLKAFLALAFLIVIFLITNG
jgi:surface protein